MSSGVFIKTTNVLEKWLQLKNTSGEKGILNGAIVVSVLNAEPRSQFSFHSYGKLLLSLWLDRYN
jgi:hypothetical protein